MKTKLISFFLTSLVLASAVALDDNPITKLRDQFEAGTLPEVQDMRGIWLGRCFPNSETESAILGALLIGNDPAALGGPLFESPQKVNFRVAFGSPNQFDVLRPTEEPLPHGNGTAYGPKPATTKDAAWRLQVGSWGDWTSLWRIRKSGENGYLVAMQYSVRSDRETAIAESLLKACYFFKRLQ